MEWGCHIAHQIVQHGSPKHVACNLANGCCGSPSGYPDNLSISRKAGKERNVGFNENTSACVINGFDGNVSAN
eukprot:11226769-Lingulodinium_polyedra.AAC.1